MSLTTLLIEIPSEALRLHNGDQPSKPMCFLRSSSRSRPELWYLIHHQAHFLKGLNYSATEGHGDPRFAVGNQMFVDRMRRGTRECIHEGANG